MFNKWFTSTIIKWWLFLIQLWHKFASGQQKIVNDFTHFKLIISGIFKVGEFLIFNES